MDREIGKGASRRNDGNAGGVLPERSDGHNPFGMDPRIGGLRRGDGHIPLEAKHPDQHPSGNSLLYAFGPDSFCINEAPTLLRVAQQGGGFLYPTNLLYHN